MCYESESNAMILNENYIPENLFKSKLFPGNIGQKNDI